MLKRDISSALLILCCLLILSPVSAQPVSAKTENKSTVPFRILTSGKRITVQSKQNIKAVMVWTSNGHRVVEQKEINSASFSFQLNIPEKIFFIRVDMDDNKMYTKKIGVQ